MAVEQTTSSAGTPSYKLDSNIIEAVGKAGRSGSKARAMLQDPKTATWNLIGEAAKAVDETGKEIEKNIQAKKEAQQKSLNEWDAAFDKMSESGAWANENLFSKFEAIEKEQRELYLAAVEKGDKGEMAKLMQAQKQRSNSLQQWRGTMESAQKIHNGVGWSKAFMGDSPEAQEKRALMTALAEMGPDIANNMVFENGQMVFNVNGKKYTRRQIDELVAEGTKPINLELGYMQELANAEKAGAEGKPFNYDRELNTARLSIKDEDIVNLMTEDFGGGGSFSEHIKSHPDMLEVVEGQDLPWSTRLKDKDGNMVAPTDPTSDGGAEITPEELAAMNDADINLIIEEMKKPENKDIAREYLAEYKTLQMQNAHNLGSGKEESQFQARRKTWNSLSEAEREQMRKNPPPEFRDANGEFDTFKFLGYTS